MQKPKFPSFILISLFLALVIILILNLTENPAVLDPKGQIAEKQKDLIYISTFMMLIIVIPVFAMTYIFLWKFRSDHKKAKYSPDWEQDTTIEFLWWAFPCAIIFVLSVIAWRATYELDPFKPIQSDQKPLQIQAIALQWKWLFIYPEQKIAAVNFVQFPENTPIQFLITADAPMNSFWIPQLAGQIYAMPGMTSKLHLIANEAGIFRGSSANLSGDGFASMTFTAKASSQSDFESWVASIEASAPLGLDEYTRLAKPSSYVPAAFYRLQEVSLFDQIVMQYMDGHDAIQ